MKPVILVIILSIICGTAIAFDSQESVAILSPEKEAVLGAQVATQYQATLKLLDDPIALDYVKRLGNRLISSSDAGGTVQFQLVNDDTADLCVLLGGYIFINKGLILSAANEAELASAIAYGTAHVSSRHVAQMFEKALGYPTNPIPASWIIFHWAGANQPQSKRPEEGIFVQKKFELEQEADKLAAQFLMKSGYDPESYSKALEKLPKGPPLMASGLLERIYFSRTEAHALPKKEDYIVSSPEFDLIKSKLLLSRN
jgi:beta-barrel assembly-enhancing protease